jgi:asparagine synthase (glutamine-hydrolysing)
MCGIAGFWTVDGLEETFEATLCSMTSAISHRGPDDEGYWVDGDAGIALGHRRLSIIDLSPEGHQPMVSASGRYVISYNGEVYNFQELRKELDGSGWRGQSDTEVILKAIETWGLTEAVKYFVGMFAFTLWDRKERVLHLVRDRLGIKPLYYGWAGKTFLFASELKALTKHPVFQAEINRDALSLFLRHSYIPAPYSIYEGIYKLLPGTILTLAQPTCQPSGETYWSMKDVAERCIDDPFIGTEAEAIEYLDGILREAVAMRMVADVPLGAFLSGGIDSSTVVALMQSRSSQPIKTFSIGFHESHYNEAEHARAVARSLGTDHTELYVTPEEAMAVIPELPRFYDEPFSDSSQIPTFLVSQLTRQHVTVSLSGDGGDELFGGYKRYNAAQDLWRVTGWITDFTRRALARILLTVPVRAWDGAFGWLAPALNKYGREGSVGDKLHKLAGVIATTTPELLYRRMVSHWENPASLVLNAAEPDTALTDQTQWASLSDFMLWMMYLDTITYLPDDILTKVDRASMGVSLEARVPLLDHRIVEFVWRLPVSLRLRHGQGKWLLRQVLYKYVPRELIERPKMGFGVPIDAWLRGPLRDWAEALLDKKRLREEGLFTSEPIRQKWIEHLSSTRNWYYHLWDVLMFQAWLEAQR